jgi:hypothetical protein
LTLIERSAQGAVLLLGAITAYAGRNIPFGIDGLAYMDVARAYLHLNWHTAINGYWGPLYSWLLAFGMWIFHPGMQGELILVHALNYALFAAALITFVRFWHALAAWSRSTHNDGVCLPDAAPVAWTLLGYLMFLVTFTWSLDDMTPDVLVATLVFAIAGQLFQLDGAEEAGSSGLAAYAWLGGLLAIGYYAKAILLYFAVFILVALLARSFRSSDLLKNLPKKDLRTKDFRKPITAALVFLVLVSPFVTALSRTLGHFSAGDSGRLNYAWFVNGPETATWMRTASAAPLPFYPGPTVDDSPRVFRIPLLAGATYAPWYDAARFDARSRPTLNLRAQLRQIAVNLKFVKEQVLGVEAALLVPLLILIWHTPKPARRTLAATWFCTLPVLGVLGMYFLTHLVMRFILGFLLVFWGAAFGALSVPEDMRPLARRALWAGILVFAAVELPGLLHFIASHPDGNAGRDLAIARALPGYGMHPGDAVASFGDGQEAYWAHFAETPIVSEIWKMDAAQFWSASPALQQAALSAMAASGAKAAVWRRDSDQPCPPQWIPLPENSGCLALLLQQPSPN